jgi:hypothetical protein
MQRKRRTQAGYSTVGTSVLSMKGWIGNLKAMPSDLRLDSGADISLISLSFLETMQSPPKIKTGLKMKLWQLTDKDSSLAGYVTIPMFTLIKEGEMISFEVEAYVVPNMSVDILLGEDFQLNYELSVT